MRRDELEAGLEIAPKKMRLKTKLLIGAAALAVLCTAALAAFLYGMAAGSREEEPVVTSDLLGEQLRSAQELVTVAYYYTNMGRFENQVHFYGWKVPFTTKSFIISYDGVIKAGVDLTAVSVQVDEAAKTVAVTLPVAKSTEEAMPVRVAAVLAIRCSSPGFSFKVNARLRMRCVMGMVTLSVSSFCMSSSLAAENKKPGIGLSVPSSSVFTVAVVP